MNSVGGFGIANVDIIFGNADRIPKLGEEIYTPSCFKQLGGGVVATLIQLSRLGVPVKLATYIGNGSLSKYLVKKLEKEKIEYIKIQLLSVVLFPVNRTEVLFPINLKKKRLGWTVKKFMNFIRIVKLLFFLLNRKSFVNL